MKGKLESPVEAAKRKFLWSWTNDLPWLEYCSANFAAGELQSDSLSVFATGSTNFKIESIQIHIKSNGHTQAINLILDVQN